MGFGYYRGVKRPVCVSYKDRARHTYIIGKTGVGKSILLQDMAVQDIKNGEVREIPFSTEMLEACNEIDEKPIYEEKYNAEEEYEFDSFEDLSFSKYKVGKK
jgi:predicted ATPase